MYTFEMYSHPSGKCKGWYQACSDPVIPNSIYFVTVKITKIGDVIIIIIISNIHQYSSIFIIILCVIAHARGGSVIRVAGWHLILGQLHLLPRHHFHPHPHIHRHCHRHHQQQQCHRVAGWHLILGQLHLLRHHHHHPHYHHHCHRHHHHHHHQQHCHRCHDHDHQTQ